MTFKFSEETASPYLNPEQVARYLQCYVKDARGLDTDVPNIRAVYDRLDRLGVPKLRRGRAILVDRRDIDAALRPVKAVRRRA